MFLISFLAWSQFSGAALVQDRRVALRKRVTLNSVRRRRISSELLSVDCCDSFTADCLSCLEGVSTLEYCEKNVDVSGCDALLADSERTAALAPSQAGTKSDCSAQFDCSAQRLASHAVHGNRSFEAAWCCRWGNQSVCDAAALPNAPYHKLSTTQIATLSIAGALYGKYVRAMNLLELQIAEWDAAITRFEAGAQAWTARLTTAADGGGDAGAVVGSSEAAQEQTLWSREAKIYEWEHQVVTYEQLGLQWEGEFNELPSTSATWVARASGIEAWEAKLWCWHGELLQWQSEL